MDANGWFNGDDNRDELDPHYAEPDLPVCDGCDEPIHGQAIQVYSRVFCTACWEAEADVRLRQADAAFQEEIAAGVRTR